MKTTSTIVITGGHVTPAIALIDALRQRQDIQLVFVGRKHAIEGSSTVSFEYRLVMEKGIRFISIAAGRLQRQFTVTTIPSLFKIPVGFVQSLLFCIRERPTLIVSFGGYVGLPVAVAAWLCHIPVITHEQTLVAGLANRIIARIARRVCVAFPESVNDFPKGKAVYTGLPLRRELFTAFDKAPYVVDLRHFPLLYVTGGGTGAQSLNHLVFPALSNVLETFTVIHQVGDVSLSEAKLVHDALPAVYKDRYIAVPYIPVSHLSWIMKNAALVVGRAGANTVIELAAFGKVAVLVPLPWSGGGEQQMNADWLAKHTGVLVVSQENLTPSQLTASIRETWKNISELQKRAITFASHIPHDGTAKLVGEIEHIIHPIA